MHNLVTSHHAAELYLNLLPICSFKSERMPGFQANLYMALINLPYLAREKNAEDVQDLDLFS